MTRIRSAAHLRTALAATAALLSTLVATSAARAEHADVDDTPIILVHGFDGGGFDNIPLNSAIDCKGREMELWRNGLEDLGFPSKHLITLGYYKGDVHCDRNVPFRGDNTVDTSIQQLAHDFATFVSDNFTKKGINVAVSAHSLGGIIVRQAIASVRKHKAGFPRALRISDVVTSGSPHAGSATALFCGSAFGSNAARQCEQVTPGSLFLGNLSNNPQGQGQTDWTLIGSECDQVVSADSALAMSRGSNSRPKVAKVRYGCSRRFLHGELITAPVALKRIKKGLTTKH
jgi:triacylglycerol esterase/lipase EstA (alpha/beta hydrolase family)